jgi:DNA-binding LytR/AlgR family response regulator
MIRIAVVEDEEKYMQHLCQCLEMFGKEFGHSFSVATYTDGDQLVSTYRAQFDIILMDVDMPIMDGITAATHVRQMDPEVVIIFISNMPQYAIQGYSVDAADYVLKSTSYFSFSQRLNRAIQRVKRKNINYVPIPVKGGMRKVEAGDIYYIERQGHYLIFHTKSGDIQSTGTMQGMEDTLKNAHFYRCNNGYLVNLRHVDGIQDGCALVQGDRLLISRPRSAAFWDALTTYMGGASG